MTDAPETPSVKHADISQEAVQERRYLWMARTFSLVAVVSFLTTLLLISALFSLLPIVRVQPYYLSSLNKNQQIINVVRPNYNSLDMKLLTESLIRQYLLARLTVSSNVPELERRWGIDGDINWMSETSVFNEFGRTAATLIKQAETEGLTRSVRILVITPYRTTKTENVWRGEVELTDMRHGDSKPVKSKWQVLLNIAFRPTRDGLNWEQRLKNPLGFTVVRFGMSEVK